MTDGVSIYRDSDDLIVRLTQTDDTLIVSRFFENDGASSWAIDSLIFEDGTTFNVEQLKAKVLLPTGGDDVIYGSEGNDTLSGDAGKDQLDGRQGDDVLNGGTGDDHLIGNKGDDTLTGGYGDDNLEGDHGQDTLMGGYGDDLVYGGAGMDVLSGGAGNDLLDGGAGADRITFGYGDGRDRLSLAGGGADGDKVEFGPGLSAGHVTVARASFGADLTLSLTHADHSATSDVLTVSGYFFAGVNNLEFTFADGTVWDHDAILAMM